MLRKKSRKPAVAPTAAGQPIEVPEPQYPAERAVQARTAASAARAAARDQLAAARDRAQQLLADAERHAAALESEAAAADRAAEAAEAEDVRLTRMTDLRTQLDAAEQQHADLENEAADLDQRTADARAQLAELAEQRDQHAQQLADARDTRDVQATRDALLNRAAVDEVSAATAAHLERDEARAEDVAAALVNAAAAVARLRAQLDALSREHAGLPPREEIAELMQRLLPAVVAQLLAGGQLGEFHARLFAGLPDDLVDEVRTADPAARSALAANLFATQQAPRMVAALENLALTDPEQYAQLRGELLKPPTLPAAPARPQMPIAQLQDGRVLMGPARS